MTASPHGEAAGAGAAAQAATSVCEQSTPNAPLVEQSMQSPPSHSLGIAVVSQPLPSLLPPSQMPSPQSPPLPQSMSPRHGFPCPGPALQTPLATSPAMAGLKNDPTPG